MAEDSRLRNKLYEDKKTGYFLLIYDPVLIVMPLQVGYSSKR
jgi:hypothetical protein